MGGGWVWPGGTGRREGRAGAYSGELTLAYFDTNRCLRRTALSDPGVISAYSGDCGEAGSKIEFSAYVFDFPAVPNSKVATPTQGPRARAARMECTHTRACTNARAHARMEHTHAATARPKARAHARTRAQSTSAGTNAHTHARAHAHTRLHASPRSCMCAITQEVAACMHMSMRACARAWLRLCVRWHLFACDPPPPPKPPNPPDP